MSKTILIVAAHPDDEILGCGGTVSKLVKQGYIAYSLILGKGITSRYDDKNSRADKELNLLNNEMHKANELLGVKQVFTANFPDNRFDSMTLLDIVKKIEEIKEKIKPDIIFTHHFGDMNIDHQITYKAVLTATRPMEDESVKEIYSFEIPSSTEWNSFTRDKIFIPNVFFDITDTIDLKVKAMSKYKSELREYPHPRSLQHIRELAKVNGAQIGLDYCERFALIRSVRS
ncbi:MAG: LmbE family protein [uncultured bacterium]|nr:MAG: LmbE family protein [uncultured bacterium]